MRILMYTPSALVVIFLAWFLFLAATTPLKSREEFVLTVASGQSVDRWGNAYIKAGWRIKHIVSRSVAVSINEYHGAPGAEDREGSIIIVFERDINK